MGAVRKLELLSEAVYVGINGKVIVGNLTPGPSAIVAEYAGAPAGRGYDVWREDICRNFCRIDAEPSAGGQIFCKVEIVKVSSLALATSGGTSGRFLRSRSLLSDSCDEFILFGATSGGLEVIREGRATELQQSQMWLTDLTAESAVGFHDGNQSQSIRDPEARTAQYLPRGRRQAGRAASGGSGNQRGDRTLLRAVRGDGRVHGRSRSATDGAAHDRPGRAASPHRSASEHSWRLQRGYS